MDLPLAIVQLTLTVEALEPKLNRIVELLECSLWTCGCGHSNGAGLAVCAQCGRKPGARR